MTDERPTIQITLNPDGVAAPAQRLVVLVTEAVGTALRALDNDTCAEEAAYADNLGYRFKGLDLPPEERRTAFKNWVLAKGFQDLARGIRETLEEALSFTRVFEIGSGVLTSPTKLEAHFAEIRAEASRLLFPALMEQVNARLREPLAFDAEFRSLQKARNCLEHRGGRVGPKDVDPATNTLTLSFPRLMMYYMRGEEEVEMVPGEVIDTHADDNPFGREEVDVHIRRVTRSREYALNEPLIISKRDFFEIALACQMFATDLAVKLPVAPPAQPPGAAA